MSKLVLKGLHVSAVLWMIATPALGRTVFVPRSPICPMTVSIGGPGSSCPPLYQFV